MLSAYEKD
jgi:hypothetical protein